MKSKVPVKKKKNSSSANTAAQTITENQKLKVLKALSTAQKVTQDLQDARRVDARSMYEQVTL